NDVKEINEQTNDHNLTVSVTPVAEVIDIGVIGDSDNNGTDDLSMIGDHDYVTEGYEDQWFILGQEGGFDLADSNVWSNEDGNEAIFALLTPKLITGHGSQANAFGSQFQYHDGEEWVVQTFGGD